MSVYSVRGKGWRYDFIQDGQRYTAAWFKTKRAARRSEAERKEAIERERRTPATQTDMSFLELVNRRLDHVKTYNSERHYDDYRYLARKWIKRWGELSCDELSQEAVERFVLERSRLSAQTANKELRYLRAAFNFGKRRKWIT